MSQCDNIPTLKQLQDVATNSDVLNESVTNDQDLTPTTATDGEQKKTLAYFERQYNEAIQAAGGVPLGTWSSGVTYNAYNEYLVYNGVPYKPSASATLPYTTQGGDPTVAPDAGNVVPFVEVQASDLVTVREDLLGSGTQLYMGDDGESVKVGDTVPTGTTHLRVLVGGKPTIVAMLPVSSGAVSLLTETSATIGVTPVKLPHWFGGLTNYQAASVADMLDGLTIDGSTVKHNINQVWAINGKWRVKAVSNPMTIADFEPMSEVYVHDFTQGTDITSGIRQCALNGFEANILEGEWSVDSTFLNYDKLRISGAGMPKLKSDYTLEGGTTIRGAIKTNSKHVDFKDFGVDLTQELAGNDAIKATASDFTNSYCNIKNVIGVGRLPTDAHHAILLEGYNSLTYDNIHGVHNYFGIVIKCKNVQGGSARVTRYSDKGYYIKSDPTFGQAEKIQASKVMCEPADQAVAMDVYVQADGSSIEKVSIDQIDLSQGKDGVWVSAGDETTIKSVSIGQINGKGKTGRGFYVVTSGSGVVFDVQCDKMSLIEQEGRSFDASGNVRFLRMSDVFSSYTASTTNSVMSTAGFIAADVNETVLTSVTLCRNFYNTDLGTVRYLNPNGNNFLSNANVLLSGNPPSYGTASQTISGATNEINVPVNKVNNEAFVMLNSTDNATITSMTVNRGVDCKFARNYRVSLLNNSAFTVSIPNNYAGKILTKGGVTTTLAPNEIKCFIFGGNVFHEQ